MQRSLECNTQQCMSSCKAKVDPLIGVCTKCTMSQKLSKCDKQLSAKLVISTPNSNYTLVARFVAFLPMIRKIADDDTITNLTNKSPLKFLWLTWLTYIHPKQTKSSVMLPGCLPNLNQHLQSELAPAYMYIK